MTDEGQEQAQEQLAGRREEDPASELSPGELVAVRALVLQAHPDVVPELVTGTTVAELTASVEGARAAYQRVTEAARRQGGEGARPPTVPAGAVPARAVDPEALPTVEKIRRGLASR